MRIEEYRKLAETEDRMWYFHALHRRLGYWLKRLLPAGRVRVLDAGCGTGGFLRDLEATNHDWELTGLDISPVACELARTRTSVKVREGSVTKMPFWDDSFDAIVTGDVLYHVDDVALALSEFVRSLKPGGVVIVNEPAYRWLWSYHDSAVGSKHRFTRPELKKRFAAAGLQVEFAGYANMLALPLIVARRKIFPPRNPTSDVHVFPWPVEKMFAAMAWVEHLAMGCGLRLPAGSTVVIVGRKRVTPPAP